MIDNKTYTQRSSIKLKQHNKGNYKSLKTTELRKRLQTTPSPAEYKLRQIFDSKKGFKIGHKFNNQLNSLKPNPWTYQPLDHFVKPNSPRATIGKEKKYLKQRQGPSPFNYLVNYNIIAQNSRKAVFGKSVRENLQTSIAKNPGPSDYDTIKSQESLFKSRCATIGNETKLQHYQKDIPAPNQYQTIGQIDKSIKLKKGCSIAQRLRVRSQNSAPFDFLKYNINKQTIMPKSPVCSIGKEQRNYNRNTISPGPANYNLFKQDSKGFTIAKSMRKIHDILINPGPETYNAKLQASSPRYSIPKSKLDLSSNNIYHPGPGNYSPQLPDSSRHRGIHIGSGDRMNTLGRQNFPGPGDYNIPSAKLKGIIIGKDHKLSQNLRKGPGPADYFIDFNAIHKFISKKHK